MEELERGARFWEGYDPQIVGPALSDGDWAAVTARVESAARFVERLRRRGAARRRATGPRARAVASKELRGRSVRHALRDAEVGQASVGSVAGAPFSSPVVSLLGAGPTTKPPALNSPSTGGATPRRLAVVNTCSRRNG